LPLYEYECTKCGRRTEIIQKFSDPPLKACGVCKGRLKKLLSAPAIQFKGSGWYVTDYGKGGGAGSKGGESKDAPAKPSSSSESKESGKSESAPAAARKKKS
jgi:putative FmdB family regulatory protein